MEEHDQRAPPNDELSYMHEIITRSQRELQQSMRENQREMKDAFTSSIRDLAKILQGNNVSINQGVNNNGEGSSTGPTRTPSKATHQTFKAKFLQREEPVEEEAQNDVADVEAWGDEYAQLSYKCSARAWLQKLDTYLSLNPMYEEEALKFATLHLEGVAHEWWYHGLITQGHGSITTLEEFSLCLTERFDRTDLDMHFRELAQLKQEGSLERYISDFERLAVMVLDISEKRLVLLFIEGLGEPLKGLVKAFSPPSLQGAIKKALDLESSVPRGRNLQYGQQQKSAPFGQPKGVFGQPKASSSSGPKTPNYGQQGKPFQNKSDVKDWGKNNKEIEARNELRRKKLCFTCRDPWTPNHRCLPKGAAHYIEVISDVEDEEESVDHEEEEEQAKEENEVPTDGTLATLSGAPRYYAFCVKGVLHGQRIIALIDSGATHNFIDESLVTRMGLKVEDFQGFNVTVVDGYTLACTKKIPQLEFT
ncbi:hypothetical protein KI387_041420 [Taxus chinensis]|uniref:Ty3 transposon capsid-like protein domain-containing protein n=1 Tax=Taxus chinensis TaxID=29808 RepID=A0AA38CBU9_TAXCH|nr:hypothetical protein KI387_041420 [Taxus chinensis]